MVNGVYLRLVDKLYIHGATRPMLLIGMHQWIIRSIARSFHFVKTKVKILDPMNDELGEPNSFEVFACDPYASWVLLF